MKVTVVTDISAALGEIIADSAEEAIGRGGEFKVALSGGSLVSLLSLNDTIRKCSTLEKWKIFFADERWCSTSSPDSTYGEYSRKVPELVNVAHCQVPYVEGLTVEEGAHHYENILRKEGRLNLIILGIGPDGHTASLFPPVRTDMSETTSLVSAVQNSPKPPLERITMTIPFIKKSERILFVVAGGGKADVIKKIIEEKDRSLPPVQLESSQSHWLLDPDAAICLSPNTN